MERCPSGRRSQTRNLVWGSSSPRVRIPITPKEKHQGVLSPGVFSFRVRLGIRNGASGKASCGGFAAEAAFAGLPGGKSESLSLRNTKHQGLSLVLLFSLSGSPLLHLVNRRRRAVLFHQFPLFFNNPGETFTPFYNKRGFMVKPYSPTRSSEQRKLSPFP